MLNRAILWDQTDASWYEYSQCLETITTSKQDEVISTIENVESRVNNELLFAVGHLSYESSPAFDDSLKVKVAGGFPLISFGLFQKRAKVELKDFEKNIEVKNLAWSSDIDRQSYDNAFEKIKTKIRNGDSYQVNFTYRLKTDFREDPFSLFCALLEDQVAPYAAYLEYDGWAICSVSPELFFRLDGSLLSSKPMKGTAKRGLWPAQDLAFRNLLLSSEKERAENVMIVDMIRNDMGRIAKSDSVKVNHLFETEQYPTLWQMVSTIECKTKASIAEILQAMFPCASITGAPKKSTMEIIEGLEAGPRNIYTGSIGYIAPHRKCQFNVAIRTVLVDKIKDTAEYGIGGGIVWDSLREREWDESILKSKVLNRGLPEFKLLETMLCEAKTGVALLSYHLTRIRESARYFGYDFESEDLESEIATLAQSVTLAKKIRLLWSRDGSYELQVYEIANRAFPEQIGLAKIAIDSTNVFLYHKTSHREVYANVLNQDKNGDDVIFHNQHGELTETSISNIALELDGSFCTPPISSGLLAGCMRAKLIEEGVLKERKLLLSDLEASSHIYLMNATRGIQKVELKG